MNDDTLAKAQKLKDTIDDLKDLRARWWNQKPPGTKSMGDVVRIEVDGQVWATAVHAICADIDSKCAALQAEYNAL